MPRYNIGDRIKIVEGNPEFNILFRFLMWLFREPIRHYEGQEGVVERFCGPTRHDASGDTGYYDLKMQYGHVVKEIREFYFNKI